MSDLGKLHLLVGSRPEGQAFFLNATSAQALEPLSQAFRVHARGRADRLKIVIIFKEKLFGLAAEAQRPTHPFFQSFCDDSAPKFFFRGSPIIDLQEGTLKHSLVPRFKISFAE